MKFGKSLIFAAIAATTLLAGSASSQAQEWNRHPVYLRALGDLRLMRAYLDRLTPNERIDEESQNAIREIDEAIREIKEASFVDGKDLRDHPPIDVRIAPNDRFRRALDAGNAAIGDINRDEDNGFARGLKRRAIDHIERANQIVGHILQRFDHGGQFGGGHPEGFGGGQGDRDRGYGDRGYGDHGRDGHGNREAYLRAIGDLRQMRAYLDRQSPNDRIDEEAQRAIDEIDESFREIREANMDDGRDNRIRLPLEFHLNPAWRFHKARDAGQAALDDLNREDNDFGRGLKGRVSDHIQHATRIVDHIIDRLEHR